MKDLLFQTLRIVSFMIGIKIKVSFKCAFSKEYKNADLWRFVLNPKKNYQKNYHLTEREKQ